MQLALIICIPICFGLISTIVLEIIMVLACGFLCRRVLLLPLDIICGQVSETTKFVAQAGVLSYEFKKGIYSPEWKFSNGKRTVILLLPIAGKLEEINGLDKPQKNALLQIVYYRFSKILLSYEVISGNE